MATVDQFIDSARYDLRDYQTGLEFDDEELLEYINRMSSVLDSTLTALNSSFVRGVETEIISAPSIQFNAKSLVNSGNWDTIKEIWIDQNRLEKISVDLLDYKRKWNTTVETSGYALIVGGTYEILARTTLDFTTCGASANTVGAIFVCTVTGTLGTGDAVNTWNTGEPQFWAQAGPNILFEISTGSTYVLNLYYNKKTAVLALTDDMPYNDTFNEVFRELLVMHAKAKKEGGIAPSEQMYSAVFRRVALETQIRTDFKPKYYRIGF